MYDSVHARAARRRARRRRRHRVAIRACAARRRATRRADTTSIPSPAVGTSLGFESALLDSLEVALSPREATVTAGSVGDASTWRCRPRRSFARRSAPASRSPRESGVVYGQVVSAETESPLAGVGGRAAVARARRVGLGRSEDAAPGRHRAHGVRDHRRRRLVSRVRRADGDVGVDAAPARRARRPGAPHVRRRHARDRDPPPLLLGVDGARQQRASWTARASRPLTGTATLTGIVRGPAETPIRVGAGARAGRTGHRSHGRRGQVHAERPARRHARARGSTHRLRRSPNRGSTCAAVRRRRSDVQLQRVVTLDSVRVVAMRTRYKEFAEHQKLGWRALRRSRADPAPARRRGRATSSGRSPASSSRTADRPHDGSTAPAVAAERCVVNVVINGFSGWSDDPDAVLGRRRASQRRRRDRDVWQGDMAPPELDHGCGAIVIWTKR